MWEYEHAVETTADPAALWRYWADVTTWTQWNTGVREVSIDGPFAAGTSFTMTGPDGEPIRMTLTDVVPGERFTDVMDGGDVVVVTTVHRLEPIGAGRTKVVYRTEISGAAADEVGPELGPAITDFPEVLDSLVAVAEAG